MDQVVAQLRASGEFSHVELRSRNEIETDKGPLFVKLGTGAREECIRARTCMNAICHVLVPASYSWNMPCHSHAMCASACVCLVNPPARHPFTHLFSHISTSLMSLSFDWIHAYIASEVHPASYPAVHTQK